MIVRWAKDRGQRRSRVDRANIRPGMSRRGLLLVSARDTARHTPSLPHSDLRERLHLSIPTDCIGSDTDFSTSWSPQSSEPPRLATPGSIHRVRGPGAAAHHVLVPAPTCRRKRPSPVTAPNCLPMTSMDNAMIPKRVANRTAPMATTKIKYQRRLPHNNVGQNNSLLLRDRRCDINAQDDSQKSSKHGVLTNAA